MNISRPYYLNTKRQKDKRTGCDKMSHEIQSTHKSIQINLINQLVQTSASPYSFVVFSFVYFIFVTNEIKFMMLCETTDDLSKSGNLFVNYCVYSLKNMFLAFKMSPLVIVKDCCWIFIL